MRVLRGLQEANLEAVHDSDQARGCHELPAASCSRSTAVSGTHVTARVRPRACPMPEWRMRTAGKPLRIEVLSYKASGSRLLHGHVTSLVFPVVAS